MSVSLYDHQLLAIEKLKNGSILCGGVGSGKSRTSIAYYFLKICNGDLEINHKGYYHEMRNPLDLYIITTARKRDTREWEGELTPFLISMNPEENTNKIKVVIDSWNNIHKYKEVTNAFFIFDEQRVVGSGEWVKSFLKITKSNKWILLSATPGDTWMDYIPVFLANGFYKNRTQFKNEHVIYKPYTKFPQVDRYIGTGKLLRLRSEVLVMMDYTKPTIPHDEHVIVSYNKEYYKKIAMTRWNPFDECPMKDAGEMCRVLQRIANSDKSRVDAILSLLSEHPRSIIFYSYDYELEILREMCKVNQIKMAEWNGHNHQPVPTGGSWVYLVQYSAGAEGWNCITTNTIIFYSQSYSYKATIQAAGRVDRLNTPYTDLYYYHIRSMAPIDIAINRALSKKKDFNARKYIDG